EPVAGEQLLGDAGAAEEVAPLEYGHPEPGAGKVAGGHQAVVAAADYHRVIAFRHGRILSPVIAAHPFSWPPPENGTLKRQTAPRRRAWRAATPFTGTRRRLLPEVGTSPRSSLVRHR